VDATRGLRDYSDDLYATLPARGVSNAHLVGWSMGGGGANRDFVHRLGR
jgi:pimeloyl-ACP methyl ester carboxylesterase